MAQSSRVRDIPSSYCRHPGGTLHPQPLWVVTANAMQHRLNATITGSGPRTVVLANGFGTSQLTWRHVVDALHRQATFVRFDNVCSPNAPPGGYRAEAYASLHGYVDDVVGLLDELDLRDVLFVGHSISGIIGLLSAVIAPERIAQVTTICSTPRYVADVDFALGMPRDAVEASLTQARHDYAGWTAQYAETAIGAEATGAERAEFAALLGAIRPDIGVRALHAILLGDHRGVLPRVTQPVSVLHARADSAVPLAAGEYLVQHLPNATLYPLHAIGHLPQLTAAREVSATLRRILDASA